MSPPPPATELRESEAAERLGVSVRQLRRYRDDGAPAVRRNGAWHYPWPALRIWRDTRIRQEKRSAPKGSRLLEAKARKQWSLTLGRCTDLDDARGSQIEPRLMEQKVEAARRDMLKALARWRTAHLRPSVAALAAGEGAASHAQAGAVLRDLLIALLAELGGRKAGEAPVKRGDANARQRTARHRALATECQRAEGESLTATIERARAMRLEAEAELEERRRAVDAGHFRTLEEYTDAFERMIATIRAAIFAWEGRSVVQLSGSLRDVDRTVRDLAQELQRAIETAPFSLRADAHGRRSA